MNILVLGLNRQIQPSEFLGAGDEVERIERDQKNHYTDLLKSLIESRQVQFIGEEIESGAVSIAELVAHKFRCRYTNIGMPPDEKQRQNIPADCENPQAEYSPEQRAEWNQKTADYMVRGALAAKGDANTALILCLREHADPLALLCRRAGNTVESSDLNREAWYVEDWFKQEKSERRKHTRYMFTSAAEIIEGQSGTPTKARTSDLSSGGCYVDMPTPFSEGTVLRIRLTKDNRKLESRGKVTWSQPGSGMGVMFTDMRPEHRKILDNWIAELSGEPLPGSEGGGWGQEESEPAQAPVAAARNGKEQLVLNRLILTLTQKKLLTQEEGLDMLRELLS